jgi:DNA-binding transcriptional LysR family regulator
MKQLGNLPTLFAAQKQAASLLPLVAWASLPRRSALVVRLETELGLRLFHRSTRHLTLTESGERFFHEASAGMQVLEHALASVSVAAHQPSGVLKVSMSPSFGADYIVPLLPEFLTRFPAIVPDLRLENRPVDLIQEGYDAAIGGGFDLPSGVVARQLARAHVIAVASPAYVARAGRPHAPNDLIKHDGIVLRSPSSGRIRSWPLTNRAGEQAAVELRNRVMLNDPESDFATTAGQPATTFSATS